MYSAFRLLAVCVVLAGSSLAYAFPVDLWVCADRKNLPYSNDRGEGFENKLAQMIAQDLDRTLHYVWWPPSPTLARKIFLRGACDMIMGVPSKAFDLAEPTDPYYTSSFVFVTRRDRNLRISSFDDPALRTVRIGFPVVDDGATPAAHELAQRGLIRNVVGYNPYGDLSKENQPAELVKAVARGDIDVAIAWGPLAGYFAQQSSMPLELTPICSSARPESLPQVFSISIGVRRGKEDLRAQLNAELARRRTEIHKLLLSYGVPLVQQDSSMRLCK
jgi:mxaJ protein